MYTLMELNLVNVLILIFGSSGFTAVVVALLSRKKTKVEITKLVTDISYKMIESLRDELERLKEKVGELEKLENDCLKEKQILTDRFAELSLRFKELEVKYDISLKQNQDLKKKLDALKRRVENSINK